VRPLRPAKKNYYGCEIREGNHSEALAGYVNFNEYEDLREIVFWFLRVTSVDTVKKILMGFHNLVTINV